MLCVVCVQENVEIQCSKEMLLPIIYVSFRDLYGIIISSGSSKIFRRFSTKLTSGNVSCTTHMQTPMLSFKPSPGPMWLKVSTRPLKPAIARTYNCCSNLHGFVCCYSPSSPLPGLRLRCLACIEAPRCQSATLRAASYSGLVCNRSASIQSHRPSATEG